MLITYRRTGGGFSLIMIAAALVATAIAVVVGATLLAVGVALGAVVPRGACGTAAVVAAFHATSGDTVASGDDRRNDREARRLLDEHDRCSLVADIARARGRLYRRCCVS